MTVLQPIRDIASRHSGPAWSYSPSSCDRLVGLQDRGAQTEQSSVLVVQHEHDLPIEYVTSNQPTANARNVLVSLHLFELPAQ